MRIWIGMLAAVALTGIAGCGSEAGESAPVAKPRTSRPMDSTKAEKCSADVIKQLTWMFDVSHGKAASPDERAAFAKFGSDAQRTPTWDIYSNNLRKGIEDFTKGTYESSADAMKVYAPSVNRECSQAYP
ncbi:hypothetical protein ACIOTI_32410 [Streptomyces sp. NPDC087843]|uniref:hypothetical protein n=1 Tax=Streptomyces sp. NPDC087843 TaxID=3365804 RepID=UPI0038102A6F